MAFEPYASRTHEKMKEVLMYPDAAGPVIHYYMIRGGKDRYNATVLMPGTVGAEYLKTYGHYHRGNLDETYWFKLGEGIVLLQKLVDESNPSVVEEFRVIPVKAGDSTYMPSGYGHLIVNTGRRLMVMVDDSPVEGIQDSAAMPGHADYEPVKQMRGFAYYVIEVNGKPVLARNPLYKEVRKTDFGGLFVVERKD